VSDPARDIRGACEAMKDVLDFVNCVEEALLPLPASFGLTSVVIQRFHDNVLELLGKFADPESEAVSGELIAALDWADWYRRECVEDGGVVGQHTGAGALDALSARLLDAAVVGMRDHVIDLAMKCAAQLVENGEVIDDAASGNLFTDGAADFLHILGSSVKSVADSASVEVIRQLQVACADAVRTYTEEVCAKIAWGDFHDRAAAGRQEQSVGDAGEPAGGKAARAEAEQQQQQADGDAWVRWQCAVVNDLAAIEENIDTVEQLFEARLARQGFVDDGSDEQPIPDAIAQLAPANLELLLRVIDYIDEVVLADAWESKMFVSPEWQANPAKANPLEDVFGASHDFIEALSEFLKPFWANRFRQQYMVRMAGTYMTRLLRFMKHGKKKFAFAASLDRDIDLLQLFWAEHIDAENATSMRLLAANVTAMRALLALVTAPDVAAWAHAVASKVLPNFGDCPTFVVELIILHRHDVDKKTREGFIAAWREAVAHQCRDPETDQPKVGDAVALGSALGLLKPDLGEQSGGGGFFRRKAKPLKATPGHKRTVSAGAATTSANSPQGRRPRARRQVEGAAHGPAGGDVKVVSLSELMAKK
jgi:hypothetical protein